MLDTTGLSLPSPAASGHKNLNFRLPALIFSLLSLNALACEQQKDRPQAPQEKRDNIEVNSPVEHEAVQHIPIGEFVMGSLPGEPGRDPNLEAASKNLRLGPFRIDTFPYPGEGKPPRLGLSRDEANALCTAKQGRLCSEVEWERACRGPASSPYATGETACKRDDQLCKSGFDVARMGSLPEWTASNFGKASSKKGQPVVRGAGSDVAPAEARCARRRSVSREAQAEVGFRCCYGAPNVASIKEPELGVAYKEVTMDRKDLRELLSSDPLTKDLAAEANFFKPEAARTVLARGPGDTKGFHLTTQPVEWQPTAGTRFLVVAGTSSGRRSFVLAYYKSEDSLKLAGSFIMKNEPGPIALAYAQSIRPRIHFSGCWGCPGETGKVLFRDPEELVLLQP